MYDKLNSKNLINKYSDIIFHIALGYLNNSEDCKDIVQEVFMKYIIFIKSGRNFNDEEHEKHWIVRVTNNLCFNEVNSARKRKEVPLKEFKCLYFPNTAEGDLMEAIKRLKNIYKETFELFYINDLKISDISKILSITESNVKTRLKRARREIKEYLKD